MTVVIKRAGLWVTSTHSESAVAEECAEGRAAGLGRERTGRVAPLLAASVHYWHLTPSAWRATLATVKGMGFHFVDTYVPWAVHEQSDGTFDFGRDRPNLDVALFLRIAAELDLLAIVRPGPHINAELTYFGIPERVIWDEACQARGPTGAPVVLPFVPRMFPVPSYASQAFRAEVATYFQALAPVLAPLCQPRGPIAMLQIDNEGSLYFRDGAYAQDYHPDAIDAYRTYLQDKYVTADALKRAYPGLAAAASTELDFTNVVPPTEPELEERDRLTYHLDWCSFHEHLIAGALGQFGTALRDAGMPELPTSHNFPMAQDATPLNAKLVGSSVDLIGLDYYNRAGAIDRAIIGRRTSELAVRCDALQQPAFAPEMGAGFPPYFPALSHQDSAFTLLTALAYGLRGFNLYMAVERDRWIGAPVDRQGRARSTADFYMRLNQALERVDWFALRRRTPVRLLLPRTERRLARLLHAFGPASGALLGAFGLGPREACIEDDLGLQGLPAVDVDTLMRAFEQSLDARGVPYAVVGGEDPDVALADAAWVIVLTSGGFDDALADALCAANERGTQITVGPSERHYDDTMRPLGEHARGAPWCSAADLIEQSDPRAVDTVVAAHLHGLSIPLYACDPDGIFATVHEDAAGEARVVFVINTNEQDLVARATLGIDDAWEDVLSGDRHSSARGVLEIRMRPRSVRMLARR